MKPKRLVLHLTCTLVLAAVAGGGAFYLSDALVGPSSSTSGTDSVSDNLLPPGKQAFVDNENRLKAEGLKGTPAPGQFPLGPPPSPKIEPWPSGVFTDFQFPGHATFENVWQGALDGKLYQVFAGASNYDPGKGAVMVFVMDVYRKLIPGQSREYSIRVPGSHLQVVSADGPKLSLSYSPSGGPDVMFDLDKREFQTLDGLPISNADLAAPSPGS